MSKCKWCPIVFIVLLVCFFVRSLQLRTVISNRLDDRTPILRPGYHHFVSILQVHPDGPLKNVSGSHHIGSALRDSVEKNHGTLGYLGKCIDVLKKTNQFKLDSCDVLALTVWSTPEDFEAFRVELQKTWSLHRVLGFNRPTFLNLFVSVMMFNVMPSLLKIKGVFLGDAYGLSEKCDPAVESHYIGQYGLKQPCESVVVKSKYTRDFLDEGAAIFEKGNPDEPLLYWNVEANQGASNDKYGKTVMPIIVANGGGCFHIGSNLPDTRGQIGEFTTIAAVYYPSRTMDVNFIRSHLFYRVVQDKAPGEGGLIVATAPYNGEDWRRGGSNVSIDGLLLYVFVVCFIGFVCQQTKCHLCFASQKQDPAE